MKKTAALLLALCLLLSGCAGRQEAVLRNDELLSIGNCVCSWAEAQIFILSQMAAYGKEYGDTIWSVPLSKGSFETYVREALLNYLKLLFVAAYASEEQGVILSEAEKADIGRAADALLADLGEEAAAKLGVTREAAVSAYTHFALAQIFYRQTVTDAHTEISDEEARVMEVEIVTVDPRQGYTLVKSIREKLMEGSSANEAIRGAEGVGMRHEKISRGTYSEAFDGIVFALKKDQWTPILEEGNQYMLVRCVSTFLADETAQRKAVLEIEAREQALESALKTYAEDLEMVYNEQLWNSWNMSQYKDLPRTDFFDHTGPLEK